MTPAAVVGLDFVVSELSGVDALLGPSTDKIAEDPCVIVAKVGTAIDTMLNDPGFFWPPCPFDDAEDGVDSDADVVTGSWPLPGAAPAPLFEPIGPGPATLSLFKGMGLMLVRLVLV